MAVNKSLLSTGASSSGVAAFTGTNTDHLVIGTYTGNRPNTQSINTGFKPDLLMIKTVFADHSSIMDSTRGNRMFSWNTSGADEDFSGGVTLDSSGFTVKNSGQANTNGGVHTYVVFKANGGTTSTLSAGDINATAQVNSTTGFAILQWNGNYTSGSTMAHGLPAAPKLFMIARTSHGENKRSFWYYNAVGNQDPPYQITVDNGSGDGSASSAADTLHHGTVADDTYIYFGNDPSVNYTSSYQYIGYAWCEVPNFSSFGAYTGNGSTQRISLNSSFQPRLIYIKSFDSGGEWYQAHGSRAWKTTNLNDSTAEQSATISNTGSGYFDLSDQDDTNENNKVYWYYAFV